VVWLAYKLLVPMWSLTVTPIAAMYPAMVGNDPTYVTGFITIASELNILYQYSFAIIGLGIVAVFVLIFAYRNVFGTTGDDVY
jgi:hypothetical protein